MNFLIEIDARENRNDGEIDENDDDENDDEIELINIDLIGLKNLEFLKLSHFVLDLKDKNM